MRFSRSSVFSVSGSFTHSLSLFVAIFAGEFPDVLQKSTSIGSRIKLLYKPTSFKGEASFQVFISAKMKRKTVCIGRFILVTKVENFVHSAYLLLGYFLVTDLIAFKTNLLQIPP